MYFYDKTFLLLKRHK